MKLPLYKIPYEGWQRQYHKLLDHEYLKKRYNRALRLKAQISYIDEYLPELKSMSGKVLDLGPGYGEFMEVCRYYGFDTIGIDAPLGASEMGREYSFLAKLMTDRQQLDIRFIGFEKLLREGILPYENNTFVLVNAKGSIEQIFKDYLSGPPHIGYKNTIEPEWLIDENLEDAFRVFFFEISRVLRVGGICSIYANGTQNNHEFLIWLSQMIDLIPNMKLKSIRPGFLKIVKS